MTDLNIVDWKPVTFEDFVNYMANVSGEADMNGMGLETSFEFHRHDTTVTLFKAPLLGEEGDTVMQPVLAILRRRATRPICFAHHRIGNF